MQQPIYILTNSKIILETQAIIESSRKGDPKPKAVLSKKVEKLLTPEIYNQQQKYFQQAAIASYRAFNAIDQRQNFNARVALVANSKTGFHLLSGSTSSGLGYALALFQVWWLETLEKKGNFKQPIFVTGEITASGQIKAVGHLENKIKALLGEIKQQQIQHFIFCLPAKNNISNQQRQQIEQQGGIIHCADYFVNLLFKLLGDHYDGDPLERWQPFKGLKSFEYTDKCYFYGRDEEVNRLYDDFERNNGLLIVVGGSGTGKSSLIKAGLIPKLEQQNHRFYWQTTTPNKANNGLIHFVLQELQKAWQLTLDFKQIETLIKEKKSVNQHISNQMTEQAPLCLLYLDQFEEIFHQSQQTIENITETLQFLVQLTHQIPKFKIIIALRNEYLSKLLENQAIKSPIISNVAAKLSHQQWSAIVTDQAHFSSITFETNQKTKEPLNKTIIEQAIQLSFALPMVEFLLEQLHKKAETTDKPSELQIQHFIKMGELKGAIAYRADQVLKNQKTNAQQQNQLFDNLVSLNKDDLAYARMVDLNQIKQNQIELYPLIQDLMDANLLVGVGHQQVKLAHDCLFSHWQALKNWLAENKRYLNWRYQIEARYEQWLNTKDKANLLQDKVLLKDGKQYFKARHLYDTNVQNYIEQSLKKEQQRKQHLGLIFTLIFAAISGYGFYYWDQNYRIKHQYYANFGTKWSIPFGVEELTKAQVAQRHRSYRFDYQGGILRQMQYQNSVGTLKADADHDNAALWIYQYTENKQLDSVIIKSETQKQIRMEDYAFEKDLSGAIVSFKQSPTKISYLEADLSSFKSKKNKKSNISKNHLFYNQQGFLIKKYYLNPADTRIADQKGAFGKQYQYNKFGLIQFTENLGLNDKIITIDGIYQRQFFYNENAEVIKGFYLGENKQPVLRKDGYAGWTRKYDARGNEIEVASLGIDGKPILNKYGCARWTIQYDARGNEIERSFFGIDGKPILIKDGYARWKSQYDSRGNTIETAFFGINGKPILNKDGYARWKSQYDIRGNKIEAVYFGIDGKPVLHKDGYARWKIQYDSRGNKIEAAFFGIGGKPVLIKDGYARWKNQYDTRGNKIEKAFFGASGEPTLQKDGVARVTSKYDIQGNIIEKTFFGLDKQPILNKYGYAGWKTQYDARGNEIEGSFFDVDGKPILNKYGYAGWTSQYNSRSNEIETAFFDINGKPILNKDGYTHWTKTYLNGKVLKQQYFDTKGHLVTPIKTEDID